MAMVETGFRYNELYWAVQWQIQGTSQLEFRWEIFNLLNRTNFDVPNRIAFTQNFGRIFSADNQRQMQFGLKLIF